MAWVIWGGMLSLALVAVGAWVRRPVRFALESLRFDRAREQFRQQREWLEARFLGSLAKADPTEHHRWEDAHWHDEVVWARERPSRRLLALIGVHFDSDEIFDLPDDPPRHATALFEFRKGRWLADGKWLDQVRPDEACLRHHRFEPVVPHHRRV